MHGEPPKEYQFKPGQSGNPAGRAKGHKWLKTRLIEALEATGADKDIVVALIDKAKKGDIMAIKEVMDRIDGKVAQEVDQNVSGGINIRFEEPEEYKKLYPTQDQGNIGDLDGNQ